MFGKSGVGPNTKLKQNHSALKLEIKCNLEKSFSLPQY